jgi:HSP20 family protein
MFEDMFKELSKTFPEEMAKERKLPDGSTVKTWGPFVRGYSMSVGPDGKPTVREFGNLRPTKLGTSKPTEEREPLIDVVTGEKVVQVIAEVPGVEKEDINLLANEKHLTISVNTERRKYRKKVDLPIKVNPKSAKATYKNGVLEVILERLEEKKPSGERVSID